MCEYILWRHSSQREDLCTERERDGGGLRSRELEKEAASGGHSDPGER